MDKAEARKRLSNFIKTTLERDPGNTGALIMHPKTAELCGINVNKEGFGKFEDIVVQTKILGVYAASVDGKVFRIHFKDTDDSPAPKNRV